MLAKHHEKIAKVVDDLKDVVIVCGKELVIQIKEAIVKIVTGGLTVVSDDSVPATDIYYTGSYAVVIFSDDDNVVTYGFKDSKYISLNQSEG